MTHRTNLLAAWLFVLPVWAAFAAAAVAAPADYTPPGAPVKPIARPESPDIVALGKLLFFDPRLSRDGLFSCATCHDPAKGWADGRAVAVGTKGQKGRRNTPGLLNVGRRAKLFWDGRSSSLEDQVHFPVGDPKEMGGSLEEAAERVGSVHGYRRYFRKAFGDDGVTAARIASAVSAFERTLVSFDSPYDRYLDGDKVALGTAALSGLSNFNGKGRCFMCHDLTNRGPVDPEFLNIGLSSPTSSGDMGRYEVSKQEEDIRSFNVAELRNLKYTAPYMHDGRFGTLREVIDFYNKGSDEIDPRKIPWVAPLGFTEQEKSDVLEFLDALNGDPLAIAPPKDLPK